MGLIFRSSQKHFNVKDSSETTIDGIHCLHLRIEKEVAKQIYGTQNVPILSYKDPVTAKFIREAHWVKRDVCILEETTETNQGLQHLQKI